MYVCYQFIPVYDLIMFMYELRQVKAVEKAYVVAFVFFVCCTLF